MDKISTERRSALMARVRSRNTKPEIAVRRALHALGYRYRLHRRDLPGTPDLVFPGRRSVIFVNGCFWHGHHGCRLATVPKTRTEFWVRKIQTNRDRDTRVQEALRGDSWRIRVVWECETRSIATLVPELVAFLSDDH